MIGKYHGEICKAENARIEVDVGVKSRWKHGPSVAATDCVLGHVGHYEASSLGCTNNC